jgi:hypothetical protein
MIKRESPNADTFCKEECVSLQPAIAVIQIEDLRIGCVGAGGMTTLRETTGAPGLI